MLHFIRERAQGWVAWFIVGLISIPFALWGVNSYLTGPSDVVVATVNGESIKQAEYQQALQQYRDRMRTMLKEKFDPTLFDSLDIKQNVLNSLIDKKLLLSVGQDLGQNISNAVLNNIIQTTPAFQKEGEFDKERYTMMLARVGLNPERYEAELRVDSLTQELTGNVQKTTLAGHYALDNLLRLEKQSREIAYGVIPALSLLDKVSIESEQVEQYYQKYASNYLAPERLVVDYIELSVDELSQGIETNDADLKQFYVDNQDQFVGPEQRKASHILIEEGSTALSDIERIQERLEGGEDFAALAIEVSQDVGSAKEGGDLGFFQKGVMDIAFEEAVFAIEREGERSDIVKTEFGYHLILLTGIKEPEGKSFSDAKSDIEALYRRQKAEALFYEKAELLADLSYENPDDLEIAAEELNLEIKTSTEFQRERNTVGIAKEQKVVTAAFSEDVLEHNLNSAVIELSKSRLVVLHKNKHTLASQLAFESVAPAITEQLRFESATKQAKQKGDAILEQMKSGAVAESLFEENNWHSAQSYDRASTELSSQVLQKAFSVAKPNSAPEYAGFTATNGNYIVLKVSAVTDGDLETINAEEREGLQSHLNRSYSESELQSFINSLKESAEIEISAQYL